ncbi:hypothetical protein VPH35_036301 [Triticum aestivum]
MVTGSRSSGARGTVQVEIMATIFTMRCSRPSRAHATVQGSRTSTTKGLSLPWLLAFPSPCRPGRALGQPLRLSTSFPEKLPCCGLTWRRLLHVDTIARQTCY